MNTISHFSINADDPEALCGFYEDVFGWQATPYGPPGFYQVATGTDTEPGVQGAIQKRRELVGGTRTVGFECTIAVTDVDATARAVVAAGGTIVMERTTLAGVGDLIFFADPDGNVAGAMRYDTTAQ